MKHVDTLVYNEDLWPLAENNHKDLILLRNKILCLVMTVLCFGINASFAQTGFKGKVSDGDSGEPMPFTNVTLLNLPDSSLAGGTTTDADGNFEISSTPGNFLIRITFVGYREYYREVETEEGKVNNLRNLKISPDSKLLEEFEVQALKSTFKSDIDKRVFNVENSIVAEGGTAIDVLETLPSIQIDEEGGISMRGSGEVMIYINGRPTNLSADDAESILAQFPANSVKDIELITNPSSRYDAAGAGGIINIILKKNTKTGFNGQTNAAVGTRNKYTSGLNLNYGSGKTNYYLSYAFDYNERFGKNETSRENFGDDASRFLDQDYFTLTTRRNHMVRVGADHNFTEQTNIGFYGRASVDNRIRNRDYNQLLRNSEGLTDSLIFRNIWETNFQQNYEAGLNFTHEFDTAGTKLTASASYAYDDRDRMEVFTQNITYGSGAAAPSRRTLEEFGRPRSNTLIQAQADFEKYLGESGRIEAGWKTTVSSELRPQTFDVFDFETGTFSRDPEVTNEVSLDRQIHALYAIYRGEWNKVGYQLGLRAEQTIDVLYDENSDQNYDRDYLDLFPSVYLTYTTGDNSDFIVNYSRRINRPGLWGLAPLLNLQDPLNQRIGNPNLRPSYTDSYEIGQAKSWKNYFMTATVFHRRTYDTMTRIFVSDGTSTVMTRENLNNEFSTGLEVINQVEAGNWFDATLTANVFYAEVVGAVGEDEFRRSNYSWTVSLLSNIKLGDIGTAQITGNYRGPIVRPQGLIKPLYGINVGFRKEVLKGKGTLAFNVTDVFNTRRFIIDIDDPLFVQNRTFDWETQIATLSFTYRFGGYKEKPGERRGGGGGPDEDAF